MGCLGCAEWRAQGRAAQCGSLFSQDAVSLQRIFTDMRLQQATFWRPKAVFCFSPVSQVPMCMSYRSCALQYLLWFLYRKPPQAPLRGILRGQGLLQVILRGVVGV